MKINRFIGRCLAVVFWTIVVILGVTFGLLGPRDAEYPVRDCFPPFDPS